MPGNPVGTDENGHRNEVIAAKCTVTALPFTKRPARYTSSYCLGDTTHLPRYREGTITANGIVLAATGKCGRRLIGRVPQLRDRFLY